MQSLRQLLKVILSRPFFWLNRLFFSAYFWFNRKKYNSQMVEEIRDQRILIMVPHVDDAVIGMGGMLTHLSENNEVKCLYLTDSSAGSRPGFDNKQLISATRKREARRIADYYGIIDPEFLDLPDGQLEVTPESINAVHRHIDRFNPDVVFIPYPIDGHQDHTSTALIAVKALNVSCCAETFPIWIYEATSTMEPELVTHHYALTEKQLQTKQTALNTFSSQILPFDIFLLLNKCRLLAVNNDPQQKHGAEFFAVTDLARCSKAFSFSGLKTAYKNLHPLSSNIRMIIQFLYGWNLRQRVAQKAAKYL